MTSTDRDEFTAKHPPPPGYGVAGC